MAVKLSVSTESLNGSGRDLAELSDQMLRQVRELTSTITLPTQSWGSDAQGSRFSRAYRSVVDDAIHALTTQAQLLGEAGAGLSAHAGAHIETEADHVTAHRSLTDKTG